MDVEIRSFLQESLRILLAAADEGTATIVEDWVSLIVDSYSNPNRFYHNVQHVLDVCQAIQTRKDSFPSTHYIGVAILAALFHDVIYLPLDGALSKQQHSILLGVQKMGEFFSPEVLLRNILNEDKSGLSSSSAELVRIVFGYNTTADGNNLSGVNEGLSALLATKLLSDTVSLKNLLQVTACIEATIPFRPNATTGHDATCSTAPMTQLYERCVQANKSFNVGLSDTELVQTVQTAALFANCDLAAFCTNDRRVCFDNNWNLLPEWKPELLLSNQSSELLIWHEALEILCLGHRDIVVNNIFQSYAGVPSNDEMSEMQQRATDNLNLTAQYAEARLFAAKVLIDLLQEIIIELKPEASDDSEYLKQQMAKLGTFTLMRRINERIRDSKETNYHRGSTPSLKGWNAEVDGYLVNGRRLSFPWDEADPFAVCLYRRFGSAATINHAATLAACSDLKAIVKQALVEST